MPITSSSAVAGEAQPDGRFWVTETQTFDDGSTQVFTYLADPGTDIDAIASARAAEINAALAAAALIVPTPVTSSQARSAIYAAGLKDEVEAAVAQASQAVQQLWYTAANIDRNDPNLIALATAIGLSSDQIDNLFRQAAVL